MFCPYVRKYYTRATLIDYDEENIEKGSIISEQYINEECKKEECGAWFDGRCRYNESND